MFKNENAKNVKNTETIIGESVIVEGEFNGHGNIVIEGKLNGNIKTDGHILIGDKAEIKANIESDSAFISGKVTGNIKVANSIDIAKSASIKGDIEASSIAVEAGSKINGNIKMNGGVETKEKKEEKIEPIEKFNEEEIDKLV